jgi:hypothetical protein
MEKEIIVENLTQEDFIELARYTHHLEQTNGQLLAQLQDAKSMLAATVQQRNSLNAKLQNIMLERVNTIDITNAKKESISTTLELVNPEQYREKKNQR